MVRIRVRIGRKETHVSDDAALRVLIVEDDPMTAQAHADFVARVPGFEVVGTCLGGHEAIERFDELAAAGTPVDIVLLDMNLTDSHGLEVAGRLNSRGQDVDIIAITAVRHLQVIRSAISSGITQYLIKPFTFAAFKEKLENQREFRRGLSGSGSLATQASVDNALSALRSVSSTTLPKGLIAETLEAVSAFVRDSTVPVSATEVGRRLDLSRVTVRRYLEHLVSTKQAIKQPRHGTPGRPEYEYRWV
ncbi:response regulator [Brevibacterium sediminis]|uniref:response regulator n=1 Tax=Brevibacterium TaxID=1696 RepID=UPI0015E7C570|nr:response regulator [Brevibacterium sediminis]